MEQILVYLVIVAGLIGFLLGLYSLAAPVLLRRGIRVPVIVDRDRIAADDELDIGDPDDDTRHFAATGFQPGDTTLLAPRGHALADKDGLVTEPDLTGVLPTVEEEVATPLDTMDNNEVITEEQTLPTNVAASASEDGVSGDLHGLLEGLDVEDPGSDDEVNGVLEADDTGDEAEGTEQAIAAHGPDQDYEDEKEPALPEMQVVSGGGNDDMMALFAETAAESKSMQAWREDLPETSIDDLLSEARDISQTIKTRSAHKKDA